MGRNSGGVRGGGADGGGTYKRSIKGVESLKNIKDPKLYNEIKSALSRYEAVMGIKQTNVKLADLDGAYGAHVTTNGKSSAIYLDKGHFKNGTVKSVSAAHEKNYKTGWSTKTNKAVAHTMTHEMAHATWNAHMTGAKHQGAGKEIKKLYSSWKKDSKKSGWGKYAHTNASEFYAEGITKAIHGKSDKYTKALVGISKKYKL